VHTNARIVKHQNNIGKLIHSALARDGWIVGPHSVDIKHDSQHGSFCRENATGDEHKKLKISWKSLTIFLV